MIHYIYIPGLGDRFDFLRRIVLLRWRSHNSRVTLVPMRWADKSETYEQKYARIAKILQSIKDEKIVLVGESAGGPMVLLTFWRQPKIHSVVTICGYNHGASDIHVVRRRHNPALYPLLLAVDEIVPQLPKEKRQCITTVYSTLDDVVAVKHSKINGTQKIVLHTPGHLLSIGYTLIRKKYLYDN